MAVTCWAGEGPAPATSLEHYTQARCESVGVCERVCVFGGEGTKRRVRGNDMGVRPQHPARPGSLRGASASPGGGGRRQPPGTGSEELRGRCGETSGQTPLRKGSRALRELLGKLGTGGSRDAMSCSCCCKRRLVCTQGRKGSETASALPPLGLQPRPGGVRIPGGRGCQARG